MTVLSYAKHALALNQKRFRQIDNEQHNSHTDPCRGATSSSFRGGNFHKLTFDDVTCLFNSGTTFSQAVTDMFFSQHFRKW